MRSAQRRALLLACAAACSSAADAPALVNRIREHMRDYITHLPDYTCRITLERLQRPKPGPPFELSDRLRLEVAYAGGQELYSWPGDDHFESGIEDLLPGHGMVSNGSYALHVRNLFLRDVAEFAAPREEKCGGRPCLRLDFHIPAARSGYSLSAGNVGLPAPLEGSAWFDPSSLDIQRLEVRVDHPPRAVRIAATRETTVYARARIGEVEFVVPGMSELVLRDRDGRELLNRSRFDRYRRYAGSATVSYAPPGDAPGAAVPAAAPSPRVGKQVTAELDADIGEDAAIGDPFTAATAEGMHVTGRITGLRRVGKAWTVELTLPGLAPRRVRLPLKAGAHLTWKAD